MKTVVGLPASPLLGLRTVELGTGSEAVLQRFFERNPAYFLAVSGEPAPPNEAHEEIHGELPAGWPYTKKWLIGYAAADGELQAMANVVSDLLAQGVWHVGLFVVATARHGSGDAQMLYDGLERWAQENGATWMRLGVAQGNLRAERFWAARGFVEVRLREGVRIGPRLNTISMRVKPLTGETMEQYLAQVTRDRRDAP